MLRKRDVGDKCTFFDFDELLSDSKQIYDETIYKLEPDELGKRFLEYRRAFGNDGFTVSNLLQVMLIEQLALLNKNVSIIEAVLEEKRYEPCVGEKNERPNA